MTYLYEAIPANEGEKVKQYEIKQGASEAPLTKHPETGEPIRRVILGGWGLAVAKSTSVSKPGGCGCGTGQTCG